jgi:hypothetical protein
VFSFVSFFIREVYRRIRILSLSCPHTSRL